METLQTPDHHFLSAAIGWLELGNPTEARKELDRIQPPSNHHPEVLETRWIIEAQNKDWQQAFEVAKCLTQSAPDRSTGLLHQAYAIRRAPNGSLNDAWNILIRAYSQFPEEPTISYNLACYACQMNKLDEARDWFHRALALGGRKQIKEMALVDSDLSALWDEIRKL